MATTFGMSPEPSRISSMQMRGADFSTGCTELKPYLEYETVRSTSASLGEPDSDEEDESRPVSREHPLGRDATEARRHQTELLIVSLIEKLCQMYDADPLRSKRLFSKICEQMYGTGILSSVSFMENTAELRSKCESGFFGLLEQTFALASLEDRLGARLDPRAAAPFSGAGPGPLSLVSAFGAGPLSNFGSPIASPVRNPFKVSRYSTDFELVKTIGRGGFGSVVEAKNKLDGVRYAVKRINLKTDDTGMANKVLREVTTLATLDHPNIVRYNAAWLEWDVAVSTAVGHAGDGDGNSASGLDFEDISNDSEPWSDDGRGRFSAAASANVSTASNWDYLDSDASGLDGGGMSTGTNDANGGLATWNDHSGGSSIMFAHSTDHVFDPSDGLGSAAAAAAVAPSNVVANGAPPRLRPVLRLFIQMQLCERSLHDWLETQAAAKEPFALATVASLFVQIVQGIKHVHDNGLIHRDIKPRNIFLKSAGFGEPPVVKLGDFGLAVAGDDGEPRTPLSPDFASPGSETTNGSSRHTTGVGTGTYASPEQLSNSLYNEKADIYSLGIVLFEMLSRFETEMERRTMLKDVRDGRLQPAFLQEYPQQAGLILWFTAADPADRPTAKQVLESLPSQFKDGNCMVGEVGKRLAAVTEENAELISENQALKAEVAQIKASAAAAAAKESDTTYADENNALKDEIALLRTQLAEVRAGAA